MIIYIFESESCIEGEKSSIVCSFERPAPPESPGPVTRTDRLIRTYEVDVPDGTRIGRQAPPGTGGVAYVPFKGASSLLLADGLLRAARARFLGCRIVSEERVGDPSP
jgi:hypothetical protein